MPAAAPGTSAAAPPAVPPAASISSPSGTFASPSGVVSGLYKAPATGPQTAFASLQLAVAGTTVAAFDTAAQEYYLNSLATQFENDFFNEIVILRVESWSEAFGPTTQPSQQSNPGAAMPPGVARMGHPGLPANPGAGPVGPLPAPAPHSSRKLLDNNDTPYVDYSYGIYIYTAVTLSPSVQALKDFDYGFADDSIMASYFGPKQLIHSVFPNTSPIYGRSSCTLHLHDMDSGCCCNVRIN